MTKVEKIRGRLAHLLLSGQEKHCVSPVFGKSFSVVLCNGLNGVTVKKKAATLAEIAKIAGVSRMTASRALNNQPGVSESTREDILRIADEMGYSANPFAQKLSTGKSQIIGVVAELHAPFTSDIVLGISGAAKLSGYEALVYSLPDRDSKAPGSVASLFRQIAGGIIAILPYEASHFEILSAEDMPVVTIDTLYDDPPFPSVDGDSYEGARIAVRHLAELGHKRVAFITGDNRLRSARERLRGFRDAVAQFDLAPDEELIVHGDFLQKSGFEATKRLLKLKQRPTAIFAANDVSALGALLALRDEGLNVPDDMSLIGFDDITLAQQTHPALTTIRQPLRQMGRSATNLLLAQIGGFGVPSNRIILPTEIIVRSSTARPRT